MRRDRTVALIARARSIATVVGTHAAIAGQADGRAWNVPDAREQVQVAVLGGATDAHAAAAARAPSG